MSLAIDIDDVTAVLLKDGVWYEVDDRSFDIDSYEYLRGDRVMLGGGTAEGITAPGFAFINEGVELCGPLTEVVAVRVERGADHGR